MSSNSDSPSLFIPFIILAAALLVFFGWQTKVISDQHSNIKTAKAKLEENYANTLPKMEEAVGQAKQSKANLEKLALDIIELGKTDPEAKAIAAKYVKSQTPAASPAPEKK